MHDHTTKNPQLPPFALSRRGFLAGATASLALPMAASALGKSLADAPAWEQRSDKKIRIGIVGGGFGQSFHWHEHPNCTVEAVSDLRPDRLTQLQGKYKCDKTYESLEKLILDPAIDAVAVFTEAPNHARHVIDCMEHGKHVISAVPACCTLEEAARMKEVKERTGLKYMMAETSSYRWETITARRLLRDGLLGELIYTEGEYYHPMDKAGRDALWYYKDQRTWRYAYPPMLYPTHSSAFLVGVTGERLVKVSCIGWGDTENDPALRDNAYNNPFNNAMAMFLTDQGHPFRAMSRGTSGPWRRAQWFGDGAPCTCRARAGNRSCCNCLTRPERPARLLAHGARSHALTRPRKIASVYHQRIRHGARRRPNRSSTCTRRSRSRFPGLWPTNPVSGRANSCRFPV